jgi:hypothetical protein
MSTTYFYSSATYLYHTITYSERATSYLSYQRLLTRQPSRGTVIGYLKTGKFKELYKIEEPRQGGLVVPFRSVLAWFDGEFGGEFGRFFWSVLAFLRSPWSPVEWTFRRFGPIVIGLARPIFDPLWTVLLSLFSGTSKPEHAPCRTKIPWTCVCPSRTRVSIR